MDISVSEAVHQSEHLLLAAEKATDVATPMVQTLLVTVIELYATRLTEEREYLVDPPSHLRLPDRIPVAV